MKKYVFGVDIGGTTIKIGLFLTEGTLLEAWEIPTRTEDNGKHILDDIHYSVTKKMEQLGIMHNEIEGMGVGVPGPVIDDGTVLGCVNLGWSKFNVEEKMCQITGFRIKAGNDANIAALGEMWQGSGCGFKNLVMITLGTGVGGGIIIDEHIFSGRYGAAGEIGHLVMKDDETQSCGCGKKGCLEQYASATGLVRMAHKFLKDSEMKSSLRMRSVLDAKEILDAAKQGDELAVKILEEVGSILGKGLANISCILSPDIFIIGGGMAKAGVILLEVIQKYYREYAFPTVKDTPFRLTELENNAGIYGSVKLVLG